MDRITAVLTRARRAPCVDAMPRDREDKLKRHYIDTIREMSAAAVDPGDVIVRGMLLCNSERDYYFSRFSLEALDQVAEMLPGRPVMVGHNYDSLPIGRFIAGERKFLEQGRKPRRDSYWVEGLFYMPNDAEGQAIAKRIDQGIYREVSLGWRCLGATCSECGHDMGDRRFCDHVPGEVYDKGVCDYEFSEVTSVLEGSLVFAGGQKDTQTFVPGERGVVEFEGTPAIRWDRMRAFKAENEQRAQGLRSQVAAVICSKDRFEDKADAARWVRDHEFASSKLEINDTGYRFRQFDLEDCDAKSIRQIRLDEGVAAVLGKKGEGRALTFDELLEETTAT